MDNLTIKNYEHASQLLGCEAASIKAVAEVESNGHGFLDNGLLVLRFEAHIFSRLTKGEYDKVAPNISHKYIPNDPANTGVTNDYKRLKVAKLYNEKASLMACSYGKFQIMGEHYDLCGYNSVREFVNNQQVSEANQLNDFCQFILNNTLLVKALREKNWNTFALHYNGSNYKINKYDSKMESFYNKYK